MQCFYSLNDLVRDSFQVGFVIPCGDGYTCTTSVYYEDIPFYCSNTIIL